MVMYLSNYTILATISFCIWVTMAMDTFSTIAYNCTILPWQIWYVGEEHVPYDLSCMVTIEINIVYIIMLKKELLWKSMTQLCGWSYYYCLFCMVMGAIYDRCRNVCHCLTIKCINLLMISITLIHHETVWAEKLSIIWQLKAYIL